jgi:glucose/arabinose dehydrogenase
LLLPWTAALMLFSQPSFAENRRLPTEAGLIKAETVAKGLQNPWGLAFLPDGQMLVTERPGRLRLVSKDGAISKPLTGVPEVFAQGQGGLLDVAIDPDFKSNRLVYLSYAEPGEGGASTAVGAWEARRERPR